MPKPKPRSPKNPHLGFVLRRQELNLSLGEELETYSQLITAVKECFSLEMLTENLVHLMEGREVTD